MNTFSVLSDRHWLLEIYLLEREFISYPVGKDSTALIWAARMPYHPSSFSKNITNHILCEEPQMLLTASFVSQTTGCAAQQKDARLADSKQNRQNRQHGQPTLTDDKRCQLQSNEAVSKSVTPCFTPSQPLRLYLGDTHFVSTQTFITWMLESNYHAFCQSRLYHMAAS